ncbi:MAG TPA: phosphopantetheine-binding protein [Solirubrobacteraceae bacterium]|jgi:acyl carrier protein|nr:phosphopantetheine-binding protein [Solirubrobacteraceae bacterium]
MSEHELRVRVRSLIHDRASVPSAEITSTCVLSVDLGYDSLSLIELVDAIEETFGLAAVGQETIATLETVGDVEALVLDMLAGVAAEAAR